MNVDKFPVPRLSYRSFMICTSPRCGSTLLCKLLEATGKSGIPGSHFHKPAMSDWLQAYGLSRDGFASERDALAAVFDAARERGTGGTGVFGLRMQRGSFDFFMQQLGILYPGAPSDHGRIQAAFGPTLFIHLTRPNKLDQAISWVMATQTGLWHRAADGTELERLSAPQEPAYASDEISRQLAELSLLDKAWKVWFAQEKLQPLQITYDELAADPNGTLGQILDQLGLDQALACKIRPSVAKLAGATNRRWAERFREERQGQGQKDR